MGEYHHIVAAQAPQMLICLPLTFHPSALMSGLLPPHTPDSNKTDHPCHNFEKIPFCFTLPFASWSMDKGWKCNVISPFVHWLKFVSEAIKLLYLSEIVLNLWFSKKISRSSLIFSNGNIISAKLLSPNFMVIKLEAAVPIILGKKIHVLSQLNPHKCGMSSFVGMSYLQHSRTRIDCINDRCLKNLMSSTKDKIIYQGTHTVSFLLYRFNL